MMIDTITIYVALILTGLCFGSFAGATMWRLRSKELAEYKKYDEEYDKVEYDKLIKLTKANMINDRSCCLNCSYVLRWYDLLPLLSWLFLRGKCRKCHKPIGYLEPLIELSVAIFFVLSFMFWPYPLDNVIQIVQFVIWLIAGVGLAISFAYDSKWFILPDKVSFPLIGIGLINSIITVLMSSDKIGSIYSIVGSVFILSGIYYILYKISQGKWIGFGDIKLGLGLGLLLADYKLAFVALFSANIIGCLVVLIIMIIQKISIKTKKTKKLNMKSHVPFGPLLIIGFIIAGLLGNRLIDIYFSALL